MKNFFTSFFATLSALIVFLLGGCLVLFLLLGVLVAMGEKKPVVVQNGSYLVFDLAANIQDAPSQVEGLEEVMELFGGRGQRQLQLRAVTRALQAAAKDEAIKGLYLTGTLQAQGYGSGFAALKEVREAIDLFRSKPMIDGFRVGKSNRRGVTSRMPGDGGKLERQEAAMYRQWAKAIAYDHPHTAKALDTLADDYEDEARRHDEHAERLDWEQ